MSCFEHLAESGTWKRHGMPRFWWISSRLSPFLDDFGIVSGRERARYSQMVCFGEQQKATQLWEDHPPGFTPARWFRWAF